MLKSFAFTILAALADAQSSGTIDSISNTQTIEGVTTQTIVINLDDDSDLLSFDDLPVEIIINSEGEVSINSAEDSTDDGSGDYGSDDNPIEYIDDRANDNQWTFGPIVSETGLTYQVSTDWYTTRGVDAETHYQFSILLDFDTANSGAEIKTGM